MKPLPEAVQQAFPCASDRLPERPWWGCCQHHDGVPRYRRNDDVPSGREHLVYIIHPTAEHTAAHDAKWPIPHPGYRAGQVWAAEIGSSRTLLAVSPRGTMVTFVTMIMDPESEPRTSTLDCEELHEAYPYLMADPACPHLAPWSPAQEKP